MSTEPDQEDMRALREGEDAALNRIMERWSRPLHAFVFRYVQQREEASDLVQETFVRVYLNRDRYRPGGKFSTWLFTIAVNLCRNRMRWRRRHPTVSLDDEDADGPVRGAWESRGHTPEVAAERQESIRAVREAIARLSHDLRTAFLLSQYEGLSHEEIARIANCTTKAVETRIYRARKQLRSWLAEAARREGVSL